MLSFRDYLKDNKVRSRVSKLNRYKTMFPSVTKDFSQDYQPQNEPAPFSDATNLKAAIGGGEGEEVNTQNLNPEGKSRDRSYEVNRPDSPTATNNADRNLDKENQQDQEKPETDKPEIKAEPVDGANQSQDPNRQGLIRRVPNSHLVYKRQSEDGTYEELWLYNVGTSFHNDSQIRQNILAGTDIPIEKMQSEDATQKYNIWTIGNVQMMHITGLPN